MRIKRQGDVYRDGFVTVDGALVDADATPTVVVLRNGAIDGAVVPAVVNVGTGMYTYSFTIPAGYSIGDDVQPLITAVIGGDNFAAFGDLVTVGAAVSLLSSERGLVADTLLFRNVIGGVTPGELTVSQLFQILSGDQYIDTTTNPWSMVWTVHGGGAELMRRELRDVNGNPIMNTTTVLGRVLEG